MLCSQQVEATMCGCDAVIVPKPRPCAMTLNSANRGSGDPNGYTLYSLPDVANAFFKVTVRFNGAAPSGVRQLQFSFSGSGTSNLSSAETQYISVLSYSDMQQSVGVFYTDKFPRQISVVHLDEAGNKCVDLVEHMVHLQLEPL